MEGLRNPFKNRKKKKYIKQTKKQPYFLALKNSFVS